MAIKIFIDQGHNPENPNAGAEANGVREQDINYDVGIRLGNLLRANPNFEVMLSRNSPTDQLGTSNTTSLQTRARMANEWGADFFISLHCNASANTEASGSEAYVFSLESPAARMGQLILDGLNFRMGMTDRGVFARPSLYVLRATGMPAVLVEMGFITNLHDVELLTTDPEGFARGIYYGILAYYGLL
ncbi:MAG: N-acetylmuramoyl-L-alanine amidase [Clostridiales bacterium]|jgi:N-acetylmuramoyl-L-alanine amidase|nr:N-acetylmuramoyl-L-alanine amidase [Clostridiales bacterium]